MDDPDDSYRAALAIAEAELDEALEEADRANKRVQTLRRAVDGLRGLVTAGADAPSSSRDTFNGAIGQANVSGSGGVLTNSADERRSRRTIDRVVTLVNEASHPVTIPEIIEQFEVRHWVDPSWVAPKATIRQAIRRAAGEGFLDRLPDRRLVAKSRPHEDRRQRHLDSTSKDEE